MRRVTSIAILFALSMVLAGCPVPFVTPPDVPGSVGDEFELATDLFDLDEEEAGLYHFETNDAAYWGPDGYSLWALQGVEQDPFTSYTVSMSKSSGNDWAGYGLVFCHYDSGDPAIGETMLVVMINNSGEYILGEVCGGEFTQLCPWTVSENLNAGCVTNTVGLSRDVDGEFTLSLNGIAETQFRDDDAPLHSFGRCGFIVVISPLDHFPATPVKVDFQVSS